MHGQYVGTWQGNTPVRLIVPPFLGPPLLIIGNHTPQPLHYLGISTAHYSYFWNESDKACLSLKPTNDGLQLDYYESGEVRHVSLQRD